MQDINLNEGINAMLKNNLDIIDCIIPDMLDNNVTREIIKAEKDIFELQLLGVSNLLKEFEINTAVEMLPRWCDFAGIDFQEDMNIDIMRSSIISALLFPGMTTPARIKKVVENYASGECNVINDYANAKATIEFTSEFGIPERIDEIKRLLDKIMPAHIDYTFKYRYMTWGDLEALNHDWEYYEDKALTWEDLKEKRGY